MNLVHGNRRSSACRSARDRHPLLVAPGELGEVPDHRRRLGAELGGEAVGIGFLHEVAVVPALDLELVDLTLAEIGNEQLPDAGRSAVSHRMATTVPVVEVADHADALGVGRPDGEVDAPESLVRAEVSAQPLEVAQVRSLAQKVKVEVGKDRPEAVGVDELPADAPRGSRSSGGTRNGSARSVKTAWNSPSG